MPTILPPSRPQQQRAESELKLRANGVTDGFALLGVRAYYLKSMGAADKNDRGIYDDAIFLITPSAYVTYNANCDPSVFRTRIATLKPGKWMYKIGIHGMSKPPEKRYKALVQAAQVVVQRDGAADERGFFGINIHRGSRNSTSSLGCQTIHPDQWEAFITSVEGELKRAGRKEIPYVLVERTV
ncbi:MAG: hypothetical protein ABI599_08540 [Flavobacteriales bacterium]